MYTSLSYAVNFATLGGVAVLYAVCPCFMRCARAKRFARALSLINLFAFKIDRCNHAFVNLVFFAS